MINYSKLSKFFLCLVPLAVVIVYQGSVFPFIVGKYVFFRTTINLALIFFIWALAKGEFQSKEVRPLLKSPLVIAVSIFFLIFLLAGVFGYNPSASFWSNYERGEGGLQMLCLFVFFILSVLLLKDEESWRRMFIISLWASVLVIAYGIAAAFKIGGFIGSDFCGRFFGSLGNPAYTGTYFIFSIFYAAYLFTGEKKKFKKFWWAGLLTAFFIFLLFTQTRGALLGFGAGLIAFLLYLFFALPAGRLRLTVLILIGTLVIGGLFGFIYRRSINLMPFCATGGNKILDVVFTAESFQTRLLLWGQSLQALGDRPILGWGPENFSAAFEKYYDTYHTAWFDRAHSIFFDYLVMTGLLGLLSFLGIFGVYYRQFFKNRKEKEIIPANEEIYKKKTQLSTAESWSIAQKALIFGLPIAYLVQGLVLFDVLPIYINLFLFLAFASYKTQYESI